MDVSICLERGRKDPSEVVTLKQEPGGQERWGGHLKEQHREIAG